MTATSMAVSKITGKVINPGEMDQYLDTHGGYAGNGLIWGKAAKMGGLGAAKQAWNLNTINKQIDEGRPVVIGVDYHAGSNGGANGTDHWIAVTGRGREDGKNVYYANDPATGKEITLQPGGQPAGGRPQELQVHGRAGDVLRRQPEPGHGAEARHADQALHPEQAGAEAATSAQGRHAAGG